MKQERAHHNSVGTAFLAGLSGVAKGQIFTAAPAQKSDALERKAEALYKQLSEQVQKEQEQARKDGKTLVIVMAEDHLDRGSMLAELLLLKIAQDRKIGNMAVEANKDIIKDARELHSKGKFHPIHFPEILADADQKKMKIIPADEHLLPDNEREAIMLRAIKGMKEDGLFLMGTNHVATVLEAGKDLGKDKRILVLDISNTSDRNIADYEKELPSQATILKLMRHAKGVVQVDMGDEFESLPKAQILELAAKVTGQKDLPKLLRSTEPKIKGPGFGDVIPVEPGLFQEKSEYRLQMEKLVEDKKAGKIAEKLIADPDLEKSYQAMMDAHSAQSKIFDQQQKLRVDGQIPADKEKEYKELEVKYAALGEPIEKSKKSYDDLFNAKAKALGVEDKDVLEALKAVYRFNQNDKRYEENRKKYGDPKKEGENEKEEQIKDKMVKLMDKAEGLYSGTKYLDSKFYKTANSAAIGMILGDFKGAKGHLETALKEFDKEFPKAEGDALKVKTELAGILGQVQEYLKEPVKSKEGAPMTPAQPKKQAGKPSPY